MSPARVPPLRRDEWGDAERSVLRGAFGEKAAAQMLSDEAGAPPIPNVLGMLVQHPALAGPFLAYNNMLLFEPTLDPRLRELMVLRVAWRTRSEYEWVQHVRLGRTCGITDAEIDAITRDQRAETWSDLEADLVAATDQLVDGYRVDDATWARLAEQLDRRQLVEALFVVGTYTALAMVFNSVGLELDPGLDEIGAPPIPPTEA